MKRSIVSIILTSALLFTFNQCMDSKSDVEKSRENMDDAKEDLDQANKDYRDEVEAYREETHIALKGNEEMIAVLRAEKASSNKQVEADRQAKIAELERRNQEMDARLKAYQANNKEGWKNFKKEFKHDMTELGKAFRDMGQNNVQE